MSQLEVNKIIPQSGTTLTIGDSGDTISFASGVLPSLESLTITGDLTVDTDTLKVDSTNNRVGIGTTSPAGILELSSTGNTNFFITAGTSSASQVVFGDADDADVGKIAYSHNGNTMEFIVNASERMRIDSSGNVGIGTSSPTYSLEVIGAIASQTAKFKGRTVVIDGAAASDSPRLYLSLDGTNKAQLFVNRTTDDLSVGTLVSSNMVFITDSTERMRIDNSGNVGIGTSSPSYPLHVFSSVSPSVNIEVSGSGPNTALALNKQQGSGNLGNWTALTINGNDNTSYESRIQWFFDSISDGPIISSARTSSSAADLRFYTTASEVASERMRITGAGNVGIGSETVSSLQNSNTTDKQFYWTGEYGVFASRNDVPLILNRQGNDGDLLSLRQAGVVEGTISVSGSTVSYNGGHLSRWSQLTTNTRDESIVKGTVMSNLDDMCVWGDEDNEQLNKMKVSDTEGDDNVAGVFVNWDNDDDVYTNDMNIAMTGDMVIRIAQGVTVTKGQLLMSAGDGTAKPQGDDIVRSKTIAKVTSNHVTKTYNDGTYLVPCVLMAC